MTQVQGGGAPNEQPVNQLQSLDHCCFHHGQWNTNIAGAVSRAQGYSDRHVILDTDGSNGVLVASQVQSFATTALSGTLKYRASFDHKGATPGVPPFVVYNQGWLDNMELPDGQRPRRCSPRCRTPALPPGSELVALGRRRAARPRRRAIEIR